MERTSPPFAFCCTILLAVAFFEKGAPQTRKHSDIGDFPTPPAFSKKMKSDEQRFLLSSFFAVADATDLDVLQHPIWLTFRDDALEKEFCNWFYVESGFLGGKLWSALVVGLDIWFLTFYHYQFSFDKIFSSWMWAPMSAHILFSTALGVLLLIPKLHAIREWVFVASLASHWPSVVLAILHGKYPHTFVYFYISLCYFFCSFIAQARFVRVLWLITFIPVIALFVFTFAVFSYWQQHSTYEILFWFYVFPPMFLLRQQERVTRKKFLVIREATLIIADIRLRMARTQRILERFFPQTATKRLIRGLTGHQWCSSSVVVATDIEGFTAWTSIEDPTCVIQSLAKMFSTFDYFSRTATRFPGHFEVEKITTVGDAYIAAVFDSSEIALQLCGDATTGATAVRLFSESLTASAAGPSANASNIHNNATTVPMFSERFCLSCLSATEFACRCLQYPLPKSGGKNSGGGKLRLRIGIAAGPVLGSFIGVKPLQYDLFGTAVIAAKKFEQTCPPSHVHVSHDVRSALSQLGAVFTGGFVVPVEPQEQFSSDVGTLNDPLWNTTTASMVAALGESPSSAAHGGVSPPGQPSTSQEMPPSSSLLGFAFQRIFLRPGTELVYDPNDQSATSSSVSVTLRDVAISKALCNMSQLHLTRARRLQHSVVQAGNRHHRGTTASSGSTTPPLVPHGGGLVSNLSTATGGDENSQDLPPSTLQSPEPLRRIDTGLPRAVHKYAASTDGSAADEPLASGDNASTDAAVVVVNASGGINYVTLRFTDARVEAAYEASPKLLGFARRLFAAMTMWTFGLQLVFAVMSFTPVNVWLTLIMLLAICLFSWSEWVTPQTTNRHLDRQHGRQRPQQVKNSFWSDFLVALVFPGDRPDLGNVAMKSDAGDDDDLSSLAGADPDLAFHIARFVGKGGSSAVPPGVAAETALRRRVFTQRVDHAKLIGFYHLVAVLSSFLLSASSSSIIPGNNGSPAPPPLPSAAPFGAAYYVAQIISMYYLIAMLALQFVIDASFLFRLGLNVVTAAVAYTMTGLRLVLYRDFETPQLVMNFEISYALCAFAVCTQKYVVELASRVAFLNTLRLIDTLQSVKGKQYMLVNDALGIMLPEFIIRQSLEQLTQQLGRETDSESQRSPRTTEDGEAADTTTDAPLIATTSSPSLPKPPRQQNGRRQSVRVAAGGREEHEEEEMLPSSPRGALLVNNYATLTVAFIHISVHSSNPTTTTGATGFNASAAAEVAAGGTVPARRSSLSSSLSASNPTVSNAADWLASPGANPETWLLPGRAIFQQSAEGSSTDGIANSKSGGGVVSTSGGGGVVFPPMISSRALDSVIKVMSVVERMLAADGIMKIKTIGTTLLVVCGDFSTPTSHPSMATTTTTSENDDDVENDGPLENEQAVRKAKETGDATEGALQAAANRRMKLELAAKLELVRRMGNALRSVQRTIHRLLDDEAAATAVGEPGGGALLAPKSGFSSPKAHRRGGGGVGSSDPLSPSNHFASASGCSSHSTWHQYTVTIGADVGAAFGAVIGSHGLCFDVFGDTVNTASRMQSTCPRNTIRVTDRFAQAFVDASAGDESVVLAIEKPVPVKGKGMMTVFHLV